jgi:hypothetical protein
MYEQDAFDLILLQGAFWGLIVGFVIGGVRLILLFVFPGPDRCGVEDDRPAFLRNFQYMYFATMLFWLTFVVAVIVSLATEKPNNTQVRLFTSDDSVSQLTIRQSHQSV